MALIKCPECGNEVSSTAYDCPKCGRRLKKLKRSLMGKIFLWIFYGFNVLMLIWLVGGFNEATKFNAVTEAEKAGQAIGTGLGITFILIVWAIGAVITGLLALMTRPKR